MKKYNFFSQFSKFVKNVKFYDPLAGSLRKTPTWFYLFLHIRVKRKQNKIDGDDIKHKIGLPVYIVAF